MSKLDGIGIIIPSLNPDEKLAKTVESVIEAGFCDIILVDDGSSAENKHHFSEIKDKFASDGVNVTLLVHPENKGKGRALKTAFEHVIANLPNIKGVVTADGDGQHKASDIAACAVKMAESESVVLGVRDFSGDDVPKRSRFGNRTTSLVFKLFCGMKISDTQTGLRAFPTKYLPALCEVSGERFEYETNMLLAFKRSDIPFTEQTIETVYIEENKTSHFHPIKDSIRVYGFILKFMLSSCISAFVDFLAFFLLTAFLSGRFEIEIATVIARAVSSSVNLTINKNKIFDNKSSYKTVILRYYALAIPLMIVSAALVHLASGLLKTEKSLILTLIKAVIDTVLFILSFRIQNNWVFAREKEGR